MLAGLEIRLRVYRVMTDGEIGIPLDFVTAFLGPALPVGIVQTRVKAYRIRTIFFISPGISKFRVISSVCVLVRHRQIVLIATVEVTANTSQLVHALISWVWRYVYARTLIKSHLKFHKERIAWLVNTNDKEQTHMEHLHIRNFHLTRFWIFTGLVAFAGSIMDDGELFLKQIQECAAL